MTGSARRHDPSDILAIARDATACAPAIAVPRWRFDDLDLVIDAPPDTAAWIQLGVTVEALAIAAAASGFAIELAPAPGAPRVRVDVSECTIPRGSDRLSGCLVRAATPTFRDEPLRVAAHAPARLAAAASSHGCGLVWIDAPVELDRIAHLLAPVASPPPIGATAVGIVQTARAPDHRDYVRAGRAACRAYLEAISLGLAVLAIAPSWLDGPSPLAGRDRRDDTLDVAILWFGVAAGRT